MLKDAPPLAKQNCCMHLASFTWDAAAAVLLWSCRGSGSAGPGMLQPLAPLAGGEAGPSAFLVRPPGAMLGLLPDLPPT